MVKCPGYDEDGDAFDCDGTPGTPWTSIWCLPCDERRRARIAVIQLAELVSAFKEEDDDG